MRIRPFNQRQTNWLAIVAFLLTYPMAVWAAEDESSSHFVWPDLASGETSRELGVAQPLRVGETPPVTRLVNIRRPSLDVFLPEKPNGTAILILPGGGFVKVVPDKEGSEAAPWLNGHGIAVFVLQYRTNETTPDSEPVWQRPLQDAQRALRLIRSNAEKWHIQPDRVGVLGFSAGGQVAAILHTCGDDAAYEDFDHIDALSCTPDFSLLIYPWRVLDDRSGELLPQIRVSKSSPPAFIVHTHDDASSSLGSVMIYADLKRNNVPAELHVYSNGGHGYGMRSVQSSDIGSWPDRASDWMLLRGIARAAQSE
ncbi:MAG: alpha/beta hydrolase [Planctomycetaceae bacterium]|nr:alpha/beta hydrolase [Planctomycetaceae bacterium]